MIEIKKARFKHFEEVYELLKGLGGKHITKDDWLNIFIDNFKSGKDYFGYILSDNDEIQGFIGLIFSKRQINNKVIKFCNIGNWIVKPEYRGNSIKMFLPILKLEDYILTNFTASPTVCTVLKSLKFKELGDKFFIIPPLPNLSILRWWRNNYNILYDASVEKYLNHEDSQIYSDHSHPNFNIKHILIQNDAEYCYIIAKKTFRNLLPFLHIYYISNPKLFIKHISYIKIIVPFIYKVVSIILDQRLLKRETIQYAISYKLQSPRYYKSNLNMHFNDLNLIDHLYSEFVVLNI